MRNSATSPRIFAPLLLALAGGASLAGCTGLVGGTGGPGSGGEERDPLDTDGDGIPDTVPSSLTRCDDLGTIDVAPAAMRRLNRVEYDNTLRDLGLISGTASPGSSLAGDLSVGAGKDRGFAVGGPVDDTLALDLLNASISVAQSATGNLSGLTGCTPSGTTQENDCARSFIARMGPRVFRRPLAAKETADLQLLYTRTRDDFGHRAGIEAVLAAMLSAPDFIYLFEGDPADANDGDVIPLDGYAVASRLSYFLWESAPDEALLASAGAGTLTTAEGIASEAARMLDDPKARRGMASFFRQWALTRKLDGLTKSDASFSDAVRAGLLASIDATFEDAFFGEDGTLERLFGSTEAFLTDAIAPLFGEAGGVGTTPVATALDPAQRRGLLTHPAWLAVVAKPDRGDPIHRGLFVREKLLCVGLPDPPAQDADGNPVNLIVPPAEPGQSDRDRFAAHTERAECSGCHQLLDPVGFGFENYDALGRFRTENQFGEAIDASGEVKSGGDLSGAFHGGVELAERAATSEAVADCMGIQFFRFALDREEDADHDVCSNATTLQTFLDGGKRLEDLVLGVVKSAAFRHRRVGGLSQ